MAEARRDRPRVLHEREAPAPERSATVDVIDLLSRLADRTEELAEARVRQKHAETKLKSQLREVEAERTAHAKTREELETDCRELEAECHQVAGECRELETQIARERDARAAAEAELRRTQERVKALQHQLQIVWAQLPQGATEVQQARWRRPRPER
jgi:chromosome segregation ATPase